MPVPIEKWSGSEATEALHKTIKHYQEQSERQTETLIRLTRVITVLTVVMVIGLGVQIYLAVVG